MKEKENNKKNEQKEKDNIKRAKFREKRSSSSSSIFLDTTISTPIVKNIIKAVAILLKTQLNEDSTMTKTISKESDLYYFSEEKYIDDFPQYFDAQKRKTSTKSLLPKISWTSWKLYITVCNFPRNVASYVSCTFIALLL